jgi:hypothetical protein
MTTQQSAVALRLTIVAAVTGVPGDSLDQLSSFELPDGALISVVGGALYRLDKSSTATPSSTIGVVVAPGAGPGNFLLLSGGDATTSSIQMSGTALLAASSPFAVVQNTWIGLPSGGAFYTAPTGTIFTRDASAGTLTYNGPGGTYRLSLTATVESATAADEVDLAIDTTSSLVGTTAFVPWAGVTNAPATAPGISVSASVIVTIATGAVIRPVVRNVTGAHNLTVSHLNLIAAPL